MRARGGDSPRVVCAFAVVATPLPIQTFCHDEYVRADTGIMGPTTAAPAADPAVCTVKRRRKAGDVG